MTLALPGFWGTPTSTVDWCEVNYAVTPFICEFFNTVSSLAMVVAGALGVLLHRGVLDRWTRSAFGLLCLVGVGSIAFHGTLKFELQMLDELPMLYLVTLMAYLLAEPGPTPRFGVWLPVVLVGYALLATLSAAVMRGRLQFFAFQTSFGLLELFCLVRVYWLSRDPGNAPVRRLFQLGMACYGAAILLWFVDLRLCDVINVRLTAFGLPNPQLHAWWHVLVSCGFYMLLLVVGYDRIRHTRRWPVARRLGGIIPCLVLAERLPKATTTTVVNV
ncbi:MAG: ceramidase [Myxococcaceae bacterium]